MIRMKEKYCMQRPEFWVDTLTIQAIAHCLADTLTVSPVEVGGLVTIQAVAAYCEETD